MVLKVLALTLLTEHHNEQTSSNMRRLVKRHVTSITSTKTKQNKKNVVSLHSYNVILCVISKLVKLFKLIYIVDSNAN